MGRSISAGNQGGHVTVSGSVQTINPTDFSAGAPSYRFRKRSDQNDYITRESGEFWAQEMEENERRFFGGPGTTYSPCFYISGDPNMVWSATDTRLHTVFSLYSDFREIYQETIIQKENPPNQSHQYWHYALTGNTRHNSIDTWSSRQSSITPYPVVFPCGNNSNVATGDAEADLFEFPQGQGWKVYFKSRFMNKTTGSAGSFSKTMSISYSPTDFSMNAGIAGDLKFELNYSNDLKTWWNYFTNLSLHDKPYDHTDRWRMNLDQTESFNGMSSTILKPSTRYLVALGDRGSSSYKTFFYATTSANQNFILNHENSSVTQWPAGDYDIYIIGNGLKKNVVTGVYGDRYDGGPAGEIVKISKTFTAPFSANAQNPNYNVNGGSTKLQIDGVEVGSAVNGGGAAGGVRSNDTSGAGPDQPYITQTAGQASDYARSNDWLLSTNSLHQGYKTSQGYNGLGFGAGIYGEQTTNTVGGFGGSGFGNYYIGNSNLNNWAVVFVHKP